MNKNVLVFFTKHYKIIFLFNFSEECAFQFVSDGTVAYDAAFWCENFDIQASENCVKDNIEFWADTEDAPLR